MDKLTLFNQPKESKALTDLYENVKRRLSVVSSITCPVEGAKMYIDICLSESCGKCVPCRVGLKQISNILEAILDGEAELSDLDKLKALATTISDSADCAIGFDSAKTILDALDNFSDDFKSHIEKNRCLGSFETVPCKEGCPAHVDIPGYIALTKEGKYSDAVKLIRYDNPFPSICALVCEHPCEKHCRRNIIDDAINIRAIKRMAVDNAGKVEVPECLENTNKNVAVIGGGPSGLTAAYYLRLMGHNVKVFEQRSQLGGMTRYGIPRYRLPNEYLDYDIDAILSTGVEVELNKTIGTEEYKELVDKYDAVYIAIGAHNANSLRIEGEDAENVLSAVELLRLMGDDNKPDFSGKSVIVIGGGNVAMDCTRTAKRLGAKDVKCVYRRRINDMTALEEEIEGAMAEECEIVPMKAPVRIEKDENGKVKSLIVKSQIPSSYDRGRPKPINAEIDEEEIPCDIIICAIGQAINSNPFEEAGVPANRNRFSAKTTTKIFDDSNVFAGGDCQTGPATVIKAVEAGKVAAANIDKSLGFDHKLERDVIIPEASISPLEKTGRINLGERYASIRKNDFDILENKMTKQECIQECSRCLRCDKHGMGTVKGGRAKW